MATSRADKPCKDCNKTKGKNQKNDLRCYSCAIKRKRTLKTKAHGRRVVNTYGITSEEYDAIKAAQGGKCAICQRATGASKKLAVDHDHALEAVFGIRASVRGLCCSSCNKILGHARDNVSFFERAINYLKNPPAHRVLQNLDE